MNYDRSVPNASNGSINRYYDPATGQFLSVDPAVSLTQAPYSYENGDPVDSSDPSGRCVSLFGLACIGGGAVTSTVSFGFHPGNALKGLTNFGAGLTNFAVSTLTLGSVHVPAPFCGGALGVSYDIGDWTGLIETALAGSGEAGVDTAGASGRSVDEVLNSLPKGDQSFVRTVPDEGSLQSIFDELMQGGTPTTWKGYDGSAYELPDGTQIGMRGSSSSGGTTIDIRNPDGSINKIHIAP